MTVRDWGVFRIHVGDCVESLRGIADASVACCVTSPPYFGLRDYQVDGQLGLEDTPEAFVAALVRVFREVRRVLRDDGTLWLNLGDSYNAHPGQRKVTDKAGAMQQSNRGASGAPSRSVEGLKPKDLIGIPWMVAFALRADGWFLRQDIIWCLSGGAAVYARTQKGDMPVMVKDLVRLRPETVKLWNGSKWTQVLGWNRSTNTDNALEIELRSGERIGCTPGHQWPTNRGLLKASELVVGDVIDTTRLPEPETPKVADALGIDVAWLCGLYLAEGSMSGDKVQIAGHSKESASRFERIERVAASFHGSASVFTSENNASIVIYGPVIAAVIRAYVHGNTAQDKGIKVRAWARSDEWLMAFLQGYLAGDGHYDADNDRWRLAFCRNDRLADDFRTLAARLGLPLRINATTATGFGREWPSYRGDIRLVPTTHHNARIGSAIVAIRPSRARQFWDIGVEDEPHTFALASGVLTHNSKPNPMPESVRDRCTKAHEYLFLLSKNARYYFDAEAMQEPAVGGAPPPGKTAQHREDREDVAYVGTRNKRSVWTVPTSPFKGAHFATFPPALITPCVLAGSRPGGVVLDPFGGAGTTALVAAQHGRVGVLCELNPAYVDIAERRVATAVFGPAAFGGEAA